MTSMGPRNRAVTGGVDTHRDTHHAAVVDEAGRELGDAEFPATPAGHRRLLAWLREFGALRQVGVEGTGSYGAGLARQLRAAAVCVIEVDRPDRKTRRAKGKSDPIDAYAAARSVLSGAASGEPKSRDGRVEAIRALRVARRGAVKARTQAMNQLKALVVTAPDDLREALRALSPVALIKTCAGLRPGASGEELAAHNDPTAATKAALRRLARRYQHLSEEISALTPTSGLLSRPLHPLCSHSTVWAQRSPGSCWPPRETTRTGCTPRRPSPTFAVSRPFRRAAAAPIDTDSTAAETARPTVPSTPSC